MNYSYKPYEELEFTDNFMFCKILYNNPHLCAELLELILGKKIRKVEATEWEKQVQIRYDSKGIRLDVYTEDADNNIYDIEMQVRKDADLFKRSRYYQAMLDLDQLEKGSDYQNLRPTYVIFICKDKIEESWTEPVYIFENRDSNDPEIRLDDERYIVLINSACVDDPSVCGRLSSDMVSFMQYIHTGIVIGDESNLAHRLEEQVDESRSHLKWRAEYMTFEEMIKHEKYLSCKEGFEEGREEGIEEGIEKGIEKGRNEILDQMIKEGLISPDDAVRFKSGVSE